MIHCLQQAVFAKNCLSATQGFSPYQLVYGRLPRLPNVTINEPPANEGDMHSVVSNHLNTLTVARREYTMAEASGNIKRALRSIVRYDERHFQIGDQVYYHQNGRWRGRGVVLGVDGSVVFMRHSGKPIKVHKTHLRHRFDDETAKQLTPAQKSHPETSETVRGQNQPLEPSEDYPVCSDVEGDEEDTSADPVRTIPPVTKTQLQAKSDCSPSETPEEAPVPRVQDGNRKRFRVFEPVEYTGQFSIDTRWVFSMKKTGETRARLVAKGFQDPDYDNLVKRSPTCSKEAFRTIISIFVSKNKWKCVVIDVKSAFLQGYPIE